jgi:hypothetical protein
MDERAWLVAELRQLSHQERREFAGLVLRLWERSHAPWEPRAACAGSGLPWTADQRSVARRDQRAMSRICAGCPVVAACGTHAVATGVRAGYWAGRYWCERREGRAA